MCTDMCIDMRIDMCIDMCIGMCIEMCYRHVDRDAFLPCLPEAVVDIVPVATTPTREVCLKSSSQHFGQ